MLTITENAADAIRGIVASADAPEGTGLRIASQPGAGEAAFELTLAQVPAEDDEVIDEHGAQVFLDSQAAELLGDKLLDAQAEGNQVGFVIGEAG
jgi:Fe-S cluster assembly iron-binding protein IscA